MDIGQPEPHGLLRVVTAAAVTYLAYFEWNLLEIFLKIIFM